MTKADEPMYQPVSFAGGVLDRHRHVCAFVNSRDEEYRVFDPFVADGLASGDKLMYVVNPANRASIVRHLRRLGFDATHLLSQHRCEVRGWSETYLSEGRFSQETMLAVLDDVFGISPSPRIRMIVDMGWAAGEPELELIEYEVRANNAHPKYEHIAICVYDTSKFGADVMIDVLRTHPMALIGGVLQVNPFFTPMAEFLEELSARAEYSV